MATRDICAVFHIHIVTVALVNHLIIISSYAYYFNLLLKVHVDYLVVFCLGT